MFAREFPPPPLPPTFLGLMFRDLEWNFLQNFFVWSRKTERKMKENKGWSRLSSDHFWSCYVKETEFFFNLLHAEVHFIIKYARAILGPRPGTKSRLNDWETLFRTSDRNVKSRWQDPYLVSNLKGLFQCRVWVDFSSYCLGPNCVAWNRGAVNPGLSNLA
jgi:hypothetical protein